MSSGSFKNVIHKMYLEILYLIYMYKTDIEIMVKMFLETRVQSQVEL